MGSQETTSPAKPTIIDIRHTKFESSIHEQVISGLRKETKTLPALLFYNTEGLQHWNAHSHQPDFYPRRDEVQILEAKAHEIASAIADDSVVVDMGSASLDKVLHLLRALEAQRKNITYYALDLSASELEATLTALPASEFQHVRLAALHGTFDDGLRWLKETDGIREKPHHMLLFGLTIGNWARASAATFLKQIAEHALVGHPASSILLTLDACRMPTKILRAYTSEGVVPFALAALSYANRLLGQDLFNPDEWYFHSQWNYVLGRHEASLIPRCADVQLGPPMEGTVVKRDERILFGCSYKYDRQERETLFQGAGLGNGRVWGLDGCEVAFYELKMKA